MTKEKIDEWFDMINFKPLFYIIDKGLCRVMMVKREDKYEYSGVWFNNRQIYKEGKPQRERIHHANLGKSSLQEYFSNYDVTKSKDEAFDFLESVDGKEPMTTEEMQHANHNPDFKY